MGQSFPIRVWAANESNGDTYSKDFNLRDYMGCDLWLWHGLEFGLDSLLFEMK